MSDHFADENNAKLTDSVDNLGCFREELAGTVNIDDLNGSYDHMYATNHGENGLSEEQQQQPTQQSEVTFLKEFLLIHLDLIQQQNDDILSKESLIFTLQQENAMLRERIRCMERGSPSQSSAVHYVKSEVPTSESSPDSLSGDMTQDSSPAENDTADDNLVQIPEVDCLQANHLAEARTNSREDEEDDEEKLTGVVKSDESYRDETRKIELLSSVKNNTHEVSVKEETNLNSKTSCSVKSEDFIGNEEKAVELHFTNASYTIHTNSFGGADSMRNLKMSIRRKRLCSNSSSAVSNNDSMSDEKRNFRRSRKKRKRIVKNDEIHTYDRQYITQVGDQLLDAIRRQELAEEVARVASSSSLEVPRWRVKVYTSCYAMEGTENLEDEVFARRHNRLENDERRRKRWDVQRIREQRLVEKLKLRQDKTGAKEKPEQPDTVDSLWPTVDDVKYIEMCDVLPVSAFGSPVPKIQPSEFNLPWVSNPNIKKTGTRRTPGRRRGTKR